MIEVIAQLEAAGFEAFAVGGCVRDMLQDLEPKDWDVATNARPEEIQKIFSDSVYENEFGTVGIKIPRNKIQETNKSQIQNLKIQNGEEEKIKYEIVEVTTYRIESKYTDKRHPDKIRFAKSLEEDLSRRDFTINAMAIHGTWNVEYGTKYEVVDPYNGQVDLKNKIIRAVGKADDRFNEDALRMMRAIRFASTLNGGDDNQDTRYKIQTNSNNQNSNLEQKKTEWQIEKDTFEAIKNNSENIKFVSQERIKDEFEKIILSPTPARGIELLHEAGILQYIIPEIEAGVDVTQSHHHYYGPYNTVYKHLVASLLKCPSKKMEVRLAALLHDVGKPQSKRGVGENATFYNHEYIGEKMTRQILTRLRFPKSVIDKTALLVRNHMFYYNVDEVGEAGVRRVIRKIGLENINDLIDVRIADRLGSGVPKAVPYKLRHFKFMVEKVSSDPVSVRQLKINGNNLINGLGLQPGPKVGAILDILLSKVIDEPELNDKDKLFELARELNKEELNSLRDRAKKKIQMERAEEEELIKKKYWVE